MKAFLLILYILHLAIRPGASTSHHQFCIVGAGPGGTFVNIVWKTVPTAKVYIYSFDHTLYHFEQSCRSVIIAFV